MEQADPAVNTRGLRGKGKLFDVMFRWPLFPEEPFLTKPDPAPGEMNDPIIDRLIVDGANQP